MKRVSLVLAITLGIFISGGPLAAQWVPRPRIPRPPTGRTTSGDSSTGVCYLVLEKTGLDLYIGLFASVNDAKARVNLVQLENIKRKGKNDVIDGAIKDLRDEITKKRRGIAKAKKEKDAATRAALEKQIKALEGSIAEKDTARVILIKFAGPKAFRNRKDAEAYMEKKYDAADKAKEKVEAKKRAAAKKLARAKTKAAAAAPE